MTFMHGPTEGRGFFWSGFPSQQPVPRYIGPRHRFFHHHHHHPFSSSSSSYPPSCVLAAHRQAFGHHRETETTGERAFSSQCTVKPGLFPWTVYGFSRLLAWYQMPAGRKPNPPRHLGCVICLRQSCWLDTEGLAHTGLGWNKLSIVHSLPEQPNATPVGSSAARYEICLFFHFSRADHHPLYILFYNALPTRYGQFSAQNAATEMYPISRTRQPRPARPGRRGDLLAGMVPPSGPMDDREPPGPSGTGSWGGGSTFSPELFGPIFGFTRRGGVPNEGPPGQKIFIRANDAGSHETSSAPGPGPPRWILRGVPLRVKFVQKLSQISGKNFFFAFRPNRRPIDVDGCRYARGRFWTPSFDTRDKFWT